MRQFVKHERSYSKEKSIVVTSQTQFLECSRRKNIRYNTKTGALQFQVCFHKKTTLIAIPNIHFHLQYTFFQNGRYFSILLFTCKLALVASFKGKYVFEFRVLRTMQQANLQVNKRILKWQPFWNKVCRLVPIVVWNIQY